MASAPLFTLCPHCDARAQARTSRQITRLVRETNYRCVDEECGFTFVAQIAVVRTLSPSAKPRANVMIPFGVSRAVPPDATPKAPANDEKTASAIEA